MCNINSMISFETLVIHFHRATMVVSVRCHFCQFFSVYFFLFARCFMFVFVLFSMLHSGMVVQYSMILVCEVIHHLKINEQNFDSSTSNWETGKKSHYSRIVNNGNNNKKSEREKWTKVKVDNNTNMTAQHPMVFGNNKKNCDSVNEIEMKLRNSMTENTKKGKENVTKKKDQP